MNEQKDLLQQCHNQMNLNEIQDYIKKVIELRGFHQQPVEQALLLLMEEIGELAKAIRKDYAKMCIDKNRIENYGSIEGEIADVFIILTSICNQLHINLYDAFYEKEKINVERSWEKASETNGYK